MNDFELAARIRDLACEDPSKRQMDTTLLLLIAGRLDYLATQVAMHEAPGGWRELLQREAITTLGSPFHGVGGRAIMAPLVSFGSAPSPDDPDADKKRKTKN